jgi:hypothetical protein
LNRLTTSILLALAILIAIGAGAFFVLQRHPLSTRTARVAPITVGPLKAVPPAATAPVDCLLPGPPPVPPDGRTSTAAEMKLGQVVIQNFVNELEAYQACRNDQIDHPAPGVSAQQTETWIEQGNAAVDQANAIAGAYSRQLQIFKARKTN